MAKLIWIKVFRLLKLRKMIKAKIVPKIRNLNPKIKKNKHKTKLNKNKINLCQVRQMIKKLKLSHE